MFTVESYEAPPAIDTAYGLLMENKNNAVVGGCTFLRLGSKKISTAIDLSRLNLNYINKTGDEIEIGASVTLRQIETSDLLNRYFSSVLPRTVENIVGVQFRNMATVGALVYSRYGFGEMITALLSLNAEVELCKEGRMLLKDFLESPRTRDILTKIIIPDKNAAASCKCVRSSYNSFSLLNVVVSIADDKWTVAVGARPGLPKIAAQASTYLTSCNASEADMEHGALLASEGLKFGTNMIASQRYREQICRVLVKRAAMEVKGWR